MYTAIQDAITRSHFSKWLKEHKETPGPQSLMKRVRALNMDTSLRVFCGPHISEAAAAEINDMYWDITLALELVNFPLALPGTKVYKAKKASEVAHKHLERAAALAKASVAAGHEPECMLEQWEKDLRAPGYKGRTEFSPREMAQVVFSFLFASQDAMSSSVIYGFQHLVDDARVMAKVRAEQAAVRGNDTSRPVTMDMLDQMPYLKAVVRESMRVKPPVTMVRISRPRARARR
jgi:C-22 sterol desaturase